MADETKNVKISFEDRVNTQLAGSTNIHWQGTDFDTSNITEWIEPRALGPVTSPSRNGDRREVWLFNFNIYAKTGEENTHRVWELADLIWAAFNQHNLAISDWSQSAQPTLFYLRFSEPDITPVPGTGARSQELGEIQQLNVSIDAFLAT